MARGLALSIVVASAFVAPPMAPAAAADAVEHLTAEVIQRIDLAELDPPSSDPAGITYLPSKGRFLIVDCNIDETDHDEGVNLWEVSRSGSLERTGTTKRYTDEPTGASFDPGTSTLYVSDDDRRRIFIVEPGGDGRFGTSDDRATSFGTAGFGSGDPEGVTYDPDGEALFIVDGVAKEVFRVPRDHDGDFDPGRATHFDLARYGAGDPEGIAYHRGRASLFVLDHRSETIYEVDPDGRLRTTIDVSDADGDQLAGLAIAPASEGGGMSLWIVDRGRNNAMQSGRPDGMLYEMAVDLPLDDVEPSSGDPAVVGTVVPPAPPAPVEQRPFEDDSPAVPTMVGYRLVTSDGAVFAFGDAAFHGSTGNIRLNRPIVGMAATPSWAGYWLVASDGGIFAFGDAAFHGSTGNFPLARPIVGIVRTAAGDGYWLAATDGRVFALGGAPSLGVIEGRMLARPIVGVA